MEASKYTAPPPNPTVTALNAKAQQDNLTAIQGTAAIDTASLMARYGTRLALAGAVGNLSGSVASPAPQMARVS